MAQTITQRSVKSFSGRDHRRHTRFPCSWPLKIYELGNSASARRTHHAAKSKDLSQGGIKISSISSLERHAKALVDLNLNQLTELIKPTRAILIAGKRLLAEVIWRKLNLETGLFEMGLRFIEESERKHHESTIAAAHEIP